jgi:hypothetical protein
MQIQTSATWSMSAAVVYYNTVGFSRPVTFSGSNSTNVNRRVVHTERSIYRNHGR